MEILVDKNWLTRLAYLSDVFSALNALNLTLQGKDKQKFYVQDKIEATIKKLERWANKVEGSCFDTFPLLSEFIDSNEIQVTKEVAAAIKENLEAMASSFR